jgi:hypothetical protein
MRYIMIKERYKKGVCYSLNKDSKGYLNLIIKEITIKLKRMKEKKYRFVL